MGKSSQTTVDHDSGSDRITARVGSRTKKAKVVFDPSDHHVPRKRNRRGETAECTVTGTPKPESNRTATPSSSSSNDSIGNHNQVQSSATSASATSGAAGAASLLGQRGATPTTSLRCCQKCGRSGPGRMPRKAPIAPWTCAPCQARKSDSNSRHLLGNRQVQSRTRRQSGSDRTAEEDDDDDDDDDDDNDDGDDGGEEEHDGEEDNKQQHDFAGFSETEVSGTGNEKNGSTADDRLTGAVKVEQDTNSDDEACVSPNHRSGGSTSRVKAYHSDGEGADDGGSSAKEIRYWSCDDVCRYFRRHCKAWGDLFHEQEIDGPSLLLMRRGDVLSRFGLKLGPAMELYQRIVALQNGDRDVVDVRLTWI